MVVIMIQSRALDDDKTSNDDFSQLAAQMEEMLIKVSDRQQECVGENTLPYMSECTCQHNNFQEPTNLERTIDVYY